MLWTSRRDRLFAIGAVALVPLMYLVSFAVFESSDAYGSSGGLSARVSGVHTAQDEDAVVPVGLDAFFSLLVVAAGAASEAPLDSVFIEVRAGLDLVEGTTQILDEQDATFQYRELLIGWAAHEQRSPGDKLSASILLKSAAGDTVLSRVLSVTDASPSLALPAPELQDWVRELRDHGQSLTCGTSAPRTFGAELSEFIDATLALPAPPLPIAVAWKYTLEATALAGHVTAIPERFLVQGPPYAPQEAAQVSFTNEAREYCIRVIARDLRTNLEYSEVACGAPEGPPQNADRIGECRLEDLPPDDAYRERWCRTHPESACPPAPAPTDPVPTADPPPSAAPTPTPAPTPAPTPDADADHPHRTSQACALTSAPKPRASNIAALWSLALLLAARARRRRAATSTR